ncbi:MAG: 2,4-dihydroxyhept-2-ene,7-dioic acid aldolase [Rhizobacter sp.]|nr:2,4-dihydroxyhept-2-ene,7-dioic acid aldolase [Rhizobacter sp.]
MHIPINKFKLALKAREKQIGLWLGWANPYSAEALASVGYDWLLIDGEHAPNDVQSIAAQLQAVAPYASSPIVRPVEGSVALIKQLLDVGTQTLLVPMIDTAEQAAAMVSAMRYPPQGIRGVGAALARASRWNQVDGYLHAANDEMCLLVQVETTLASRNLAEIAAVDGVDGVFFGPSDLSASMGLLGQPGHPEVYRALLDGIATVNAAGKAAGILATDPTKAREYLDAGALFVAVGLDTSLLLRAAIDLAKTFGRGAGAVASKSGY